jgi:hypothetical protein
LNVFTYRLALTLGYGFLSLFETEARYEDRVHLMGKVGERQGMAILTRLLADLPPAQILPRPLIALLQPQAMIPFILGPPGSSMLHLIWKPECLKLAKAVSQFTRIRLGLELSEQDAVSDPPGHVAAMLA